MTIFYLISGIIFVLVSLIFALVGKWLIVAFCIFMAIFYFYMRSKEKKKLTAPEIEMRFQTFRRR